MVTLMKKITIAIQGNNLFFKYRSNKLPSVNLMNTNIISDNELVFSDEYILSNLSIVSLFIKDLFYEKKISSVTISDNNLAILVLDLLSTIKNIDLLILKEDDNLSYELCSKIIDIKNIKKVNCYAIPTFMLEILDKNGIVAESRNEVLFTSDFMLENELTSFSKMYYKKVVKIKKNLSEDDIEDFKTFCNISKYLKVIRLEKFNKQLVEEVVKILISLKMRNITIEIYDDVNNQDDITYLKSENKNLKSRHKISIKLVYSEDYLAKNYLKQVIFTTLSICSVVIVCIITGILGYTFITNYKADKDVTAITNDIKELLVENVDSEKGTSEVIDLSENLSYEKLLELNKDTVGWIKVLGTNINYPVVQSNDNKYYLYRNFYKERASTGWVYMDYRNDPKKLDKQTLIYAHNNRYHSTVMFGTLPNVRKKDWQSNSDNLVITFNTLNQNLKWKVFSIYVIDVTNDYLITDFDDDKEYQEFLDMITNRSDYTFSTKVTTNDKILTLSTCFGNDERLVVHAVLLNEED